MAGEIFISYRRADEAWARLLHDQLRREGVEAWYDAQVGAGQDWRIATAKALEASQIFVLLFSANAAQSSDIAKELAAATLEKKLIIPVRLENIAPKGAFLYELASRNWINAYDDTEAKLAELAKGLAYLVRTGARDESVLPFERTAARRKFPSPPVLIGAAILAVIAAAAIAAWLLWPAPRWTVASSRPFISTLALEDYPAFSPDGKTLAYTAGPEGGRRQIFIRSLAGGEGVKIAADAYDDASPTWSSDGARLAYVAIKPGEPCHIMVATVPARGDWNTSLAWAQDSETLLASISGAVGGSEIVAHPLNGGAPYSVYTTATKVGDFATGGNLLALETDTSRGSLARATQTPAAQPDIIDPSNGLTWSPSFAPDGTMVFLSNRSGNNAVWIMKPGAPSTMLLDGGLAALYRVRFSPDGTRLVVASETTQSVTVKIMTVAGASLASFETPSLGLGLPGWTPDGKAVLMFDRNLLRTVTIPIDDPARRTPFAAQHWVGVAIRKDGTFATRADTPGIWRIDGSAPRQINSLYPTFYQPPLAFRGADVLVPEYGQGSVPRILAQPLSGGPSRPLAYAPGAVNQPGFQTDFAVNPVTGEIVYTAQVSRDTNIDLLTLARH